MHDPTAPRVPRGRGILVSGGAGFIGSHLVRALVAQGHVVRVVDALVGQVHGANGALSPGHPAAATVDGAEFVHADVRDIAAWRRALDGVDAVVHLAAEVGVGQSMYEIVRYMSANTLGTANLLEVLAAGGHAVRRLVVASSMSVYGEGAYRCAGCGPVAPPLRGPEQLAARRWEVECPACGAPLAPVPTPEEKPLQPASVYAISKRDQEELCLNVGPAYGIGTVALRFFNVYGPGQALSNPYTGVAAIFAGRLLTGRAPLVFEDGCQLRDFVHVGDVVQALCLALARDDVSGAVFNIGSGAPRTVLDVARALATALGADVAPRVVGQYRVGDIRHCFADIGRARARLGYAPRADFEAEVGALAAWVRQQTVVDRVEAAKAELDRRGLAR